MPNVDSKADRTIHSTLREVTANVPSRAIPPIASSAPADADLALFSDLDEAVIRLDGNGRLDFANDPARRLLGIPASVDGALPSLAVAVAWLAAAIEPALTAARPAVVNVQDVGQSRWLRCRIHPLPRGTVVLIEDVTLRQLAELARQRVLKQAAVNAEPSEVAHEFNNVVMALIGNVELAETELAAQPELLESLSEVRAAAERALVLGKQLVESMQGYSVPVTPRRKAEPRTSRQRQRGSR